MSEEAEKAQRPLLRVVRGNPDDHELAALTTVLAAAAAAGPGTEERPKRPSLWAEPSARLRRPLRPGPGAWRASGLPR